MQLAATRQVMATVLGAMCVLFIGLGMSGPTHAQPPATRPAAPPQTAPAPAAEHQEAVVTLLDGGPQPRHVLRLKAVKGSSAAFEMVMNMSMGMTMGAMKQPPQILPGIRMVAQMNVTDVKPNGDAACDFEFTDASLIDTPGAQPMVINMMKQSIESMKGTRGSTVLSNRCVSRESTVTLPPDADQMMRQQVDQMSHAMNQMSVPLPEEAVGIGGRWRVVSEMTMGGIKFKMTNEVTLADVQGDVISLEMAITQEAPPQDINNPQIPAGAKARLNSLKASGEASSTVNLTRVAPVSGKSKVTSDTAMSISMQNMPPQNMIQHMEIATTVNDVPVKPAGAREAPATQPAGAP